MKERAHDDSMAEILRSDPTYALELLNSILEDGDQGELLIALRQMTKAFGGIPKIAEEAQLNRTQLYRTLSKQGNPEIRSLAAVLKTMGLRLAVQPIRKRTTRTRNSNLAVR
jgi:probable addiction module antidote protein